MGLKSFLGPSGGEFEDRDSLDKGNICVEIPSLLDSGEGLGTCSMSSKSSALMIVMSPFSMIL